MIAGVEPACGEMLSQPPPEDAAAQSSPLTGLETVTCFGKMSTAPSVALKLTPAGAAENAGGAARTLRIQSLKPDRKSVV